MSCPVCFGGDDPVVRESLNAGIGVLLGVTGIVLAAFARFFISLARRSREAAHLVGMTDPKSRFPTPDPPSGPAGPIGRWDQASWELTAGRRHAAGSTASDGASR